MAAFNTFVSIASLQYPTVSMCVCDAVCACAVVVDIKLRAVQSYTVVHAA